MSTGVQAMSSRRLGEGQLSEMAIPLNGGLVTVAAISIPLSAVLIWLAPDLFSLISTDDLVIEEGTPYLRARLVAMIAIGANFAFRGYWNGVNLSRLYLRTLLVMHVCNVFLNFALIFGYFGFPELGAPGAGIGTAISTFVGTGYYFYLGRKYAGTAGFLRGIPSVKTLAAMLRLSVPSGVQSMLFAAGMVTLFTIIDRVGTAEVAAGNVLINLTLVAYLPGLGLGLAAASLVGQALGRKDVDDAERWGWDVVKIGVLVMAALGLPMALVPELILSAFSSKAPEVLELAALPLRLVGLTIFFEAFGMVLLNATMGAGATSVAMAISVVAQWGLFLPAAWLVGPRLGYGLIGIWIANITYRLLHAAVFAGFWRSRRWANVDV
jgi:putative MATE family efflux protein